MDDRSKSKKELIDEVAGLRRRLEKQEESSSECRVIEQHQAEKALHESELKYRSIFENAVEGIFQSTPDSRLIAVNPAMAGIFGYSSPEEMVREVTNIGRQLYTDYGNRQAFEKILQENGSVSGFEAQFFRKDGTLLWGSLNVRTLRDEAGQVYCYEGTLVDITARKDAEEELRRSEEKYRNIFENASEGIFQVTPDGRYLSVNPALARIHGFSSPAEMMLSVTDIAHQLYVDPSRRAELRRLLDEHGFVKDFQVLMRRKDMGLQWVSVTSHAVRGTGGTILYYEGTLEDITSRKFTAEENERLRSALEGMIRTISTMTEMKDPCTRGHQQRVSGLAAAIASEIGLTQDMVERIGVAGAIHDIGKISVPAEILNKPVPLTEAEYSLVKVHPRAGHDMVQGAGLPYQTAAIILQHHERLDGSGYPQGLKGPDIALEARILAVADVVEAMTSPRSYRPAYSLDRALDEIEGQRGSLYDPGAVNICLRLFREKDFQL